MTLNEESLPSRNQKIGRRRFIWYVGGGVVVVVAAATGLYYYSKQGGPSTTTSVSTSPTTSVSTSPTTSVSPTTPVQGGTLNVAHHSDPSSFCPVESNLANNIPNSQMYNGLIEYNWDGSIAPDLAESWVFSPDGLSATFNLVHNAKWHDGVPFTADDVTNNIALYNKFNTTAAAIFANIANMATPDSYTLQLTFKNPQPQSSLFQVLGGLYGLVVPKHIYDMSVITDYRTVPQTTGASPPIGTGPFVFNKRDPGADVILDKNPNYWKPGLPYLDRIVYKIITDPSARTLALQSGDVDMIMRGTPVTDAKTLLSNPTYQGVTNMGGNQFVLFLNTRNKPLDDVRFRQALAYAINKKTMVDTVFLGLKTPSDSWYPATDWAVKVSDPNVTKYAFDLAKANSLLDAMGLKPDANGTRATLNFPIDNSQTAEIQMAQLIQTYLIPIGINVNIDPLDSATNTDVVEYGWKFDMTILIESDGPDPISARVDIDPKYNQPSYGDNDWSGYSNPLITQLYDQAASTTDPAKALPIYYQIQETIANDVPAIPICPVFFSVIWNKKVQGVPNTNDLMIRALETIWISPS